MLTILPAVITSVCLLGAVDGTPTDPSAIGVLTTTDPVVWIEGEAVLAVQVVLDEHGTSRVEVTRADSHGVVSIDAGAFEGAGEVARSDQGWTLRQLTRASTAAADQLESSIAQFARSRLSCTTEVLFYEGAPGFICRATTTRCTDIQLIPPQQVTCWTQVRCTNGSEIQDVSWNCQKPVKPAADLQIGIGQDATATN